MKYRLNNQGYGSLVTPGPETVGAELLIETSAEAEGMTVKLTSEADGSPYYARVTGGRCLFPRRALKGRVGVSIIHSKGTIPCSPLIAIETGDGVTVVPDVTDLLSRLARAERDISDALAVHRALETKYKALEDRLVKLFSGPNFI